LIIEHEYFLSEVLLHAVASWKRGDIKKSIHAAKVARNQFDGATIRQDCYWSFSLFFSRKTATLLQMWLQFSYFSSIRNELSRESCMWQEKKNVLETFMR
jgi:hypothetical protein